jgi:hypothetical protein
MPDEVPLSWYAADLPEEQRAALQQLQGVQQRTQRAARGAAKAAPRAIPCARAQLWTPAGGLDQPDAVPAEQLNWESWQHRQAAYSYWWWHFHTQRRRTLAPVPWAAPPWPGAQLVQGV